VIDALLKIPALAFANFNIGVMPAEPKVLSWAICSRPIASAISVVTHPTSWL
jgi:hypothetical protein